ncbi:MAG: hypothetical protein M1818_007896 [Claussenomyces sp. TS43310]|nr:MAG: hypothetical protein M1818_007896 [Claussenomyces sp. TS43310]
MSPAATLVLLLFGISALFVLMVAIILYDYTSRNSLIRDLLHRIRSLFVRNAGGANAA